MASADEIARHRLWLEQRQRRVAKRLELERAMAGDPVAAGMVRAAYQPLVNAALDRQVPPTDPADDDPESPVVKNHDVNL